MKAFVFVQQRIRSSRLPGKAQAKIGKWTLTERVVMRAASVFGPSSVCLAVPYGDDFSWAYSYPGWVYRHRGDESNLVERLSGALSAYRFMHGEPDVVIRLTGDCPFVPKCVAAVTAVAVAPAGHAYAESRSDPSDRPNGIDVQAFRPEIVDEMARADLTRAEREHITPALRLIAGRPHLIESANGVVLDDLPDFRITVDDAHDLERARRIAAHINDPSLQDLVDLRLRSPELFR